MNAIRRSSFLMELYLWLQNPLDAIQVPLKALGLFLALLIVKSILDAGSTWDGLGHCFDVVNSGELIPEWVRDWYEQEFGPEDLT